MDNNLNLSNYLTTDNSVKNKILKNINIIKKNYVIYLMLVPGIIYFIVFKYIPTFGSIIAFKDYHILKGILNSPWTNPIYKHFLYFFKSRYFEQLLTNTLLISFYKLFMGVPVSVFLAIALSEVARERFKKIIQTISFMPHFLSWVIVYGIFYAFLSESNGFINIFMKNVFNKTIPFLHSSYWFRSILVGSNIWKEAGFGAIIYIAAIAGISPTLYEAAKMDGASRLRRIWHITLPGLRRVILVVTILRLGRIMEAGFEQVLIMYNVHVYDVADIIGTWVYRTGMQQLNFSLATAVGLFRGVIGLILVVTVNKIAKRWGEAIW